MSKLLRANFVRLWKSKIFWIGILFMSAMGMSAVGSNYMELTMREGYRPNIDHVLFSGCIAMPLVAAVFTGLFIGTEYSDGTIRNKLIVGHARSAVYFANFIVALSAIIMMHLAYIMVIVLIGFPIIGNIEQTVETLLILFLISIVTLTAIAALLVLISMLIHNKANGSVVGIIVSIVLILSAMYIFARLNEPEYYEEYNITFTDDSGEVHEEHSEKQINHYYLRGTKRKVYEFLYDFLPGCQMYQIAEQEVSDYTRLVLYSLSIIVVVSAGGVICFRRQDLK